jgi:hypothetical protein
VRTKALSLGLSRKFREIVTMIPNKMMKMEVIFDFFQEYNNQKRNIILYEDWQVLQ